MNNILNQAFLNYIKSEEGSKKTEHLLPYDIVENKIYIFMLHRYFEGM